MVSYDHCKPKSDKKHLGKRLFEKMKVLLVEEISFEIFFAPDKSKSLAVNMVMRENTSGFNDKSQ